MCLETCEMLSTQHIQISPALESEQKGNIDLEFSVLSENI